MAAGCVAERRVPKAKQQNHSQVWGIIHHLVFEGIVKDHDFALLRLSPLILHPNAALACVARWDDQAEVSR